MIKKSRIIATYSNHFVLESEPEILAEPMGKLRQKDLKVICGDFVEYFIKDNTAYIENVLPRMNYLSRPRIANIDFAYVVISMYSPEFSQILLDTYLSFLSLQNIEVKIIITKKDLAPQKDLDEIVNVIAYYESIGYPCFLIGNDDDFELERLKLQFNHEISVFMGQTGAGKSSLFNKLDLSLDLNTQEISKALNRGKHTTRFTKLYKINDSFIADTPGFSALKVSTYDEIDISESFKEFLVLREDCRFRNCLHLLEPDCNVKNNIEFNKYLKIRYENYLKFIKEKRKI